MGLWCSGGGGGVVCGGGGGGWAYGVAVSMFDFRCSDRGSNPGRGRKISSCLRLQLTTLDKFTQPNHEGN